MEIFLLPSVSIGNLRALPPGPGVYYVTAIWLVFYVGKSQNLQRRWRSHHRYAEVKALHPFGKIHYRMVSPHCLDQLEGKEIRRLKPYWNQKAPLSSFAILRLRFMLGLGIAGFIASAMTTILLLVKILLF